MYVNRKDKLIRHTSQFNAVQYYNITNYDTIINIYFNTFLTMSPKTEHYELRKDRCYGKVVVTGLDYIVQVYLIKWPLSVRYLFVTTLRPQDGSIRH